MEQLRGVARMATARVTASTPRRQASNHPFPTTYIINAFIFVSATIVMGTLSYFIYYLRMDSMGVPSQFIFLLSLSCVTLIAIAFETYTHVFGKASPQITLYINATLLLAWVAGLGWISSKIGDMVLSHTCTKAIWQTDMGVMVCRIYKAMYSFIVVGTGSVAAAVILDVSVLREVLSRGAYREMKDDQKQGKDQGLKRSASGMSGMAARRSGFGLRGGNYMELKESPELGGDADEDGDMGQRLVGRSPDLRYDGQSPDLSEYERTPKL